jgi:hypothetical protein
MKISQITINELLECFHSKVLTVGEVLITKDNIDWISSNVNSTKGSNIPITITSESLPKNFPVKFLAFVTRPEFDYSNKGYPKYKGKIVILGAIDSTNAPVDITELTLTSDTHELQVIDYEYNQILNVVTNPTKLDFSNCRRDIIFVKDNNESYVFSHVPHLHKVVASNKETSSNICIPDMYGVNVKEGDYISPDAGVVGRQPGVETSEVKHVKCTTCGGLAIPTNLGGICTSSTHMDIVKVEDLVSTLHGYSDELNMMSKDLKDIIRIGTLASIDIIQLNNVVDYDRETPYISDETIELDLSEMKGEVDEEINNPENLILKGHTFNVEGLAPIVKEWVELKGGTLTTSGTSLTMEKLTTVVKAITTSK